MSLQVWLPLTKDLRQQGIDNSRVTGSNVTINSNGKLGSCYSFNGSNSYLLSDSSPFSNSTDEWSYACWFKPNNQHNGCLFSSRTSTNSTGMTIFYYSSQIIFDDGARWQFTPSIAISTGIWNHLVFVRKKGVGKYCYLNGNLVGSTTTTGTPTIIGTKYAIGGSQTGNNTVSGNQLNGYLNDVRVYDHCLSLIEIKQLSQGLILHYPLSDNSIQQLNNCYNYSTFNTSATTGGWSHWGSSGHKGDYGQNTDPNYIYRAEQPYSHWVADGVDATKNYLVYQSPAFEGGQRSLQCICKEESGLPINETIVFPDWNARSGGAITGKWTSIISLGDGFYHCKCENIQQDGSNNLIGFYIRPGYKVYFSEAYVENDRECCSDIFYSTNVVYDTSGFCNNGTIIGTFTISNNTPKYAVSTTAIGGASTYLEGPVLPEEAKTVALWIKNTSKSSNGAIFNDKTTGLQIGLLNSLLYMNSKASTAGFTTTHWINGEWNHVVAVNNNGTRSLYVNGQPETQSGASNYYIHNADNCWLWNRSYNNNYPFNGSLSDLRIYATALSAEDVKSLYQNCATIDPDGTIRGQIRS